MCKMCVEWEKKQGRKIYPVEVALYHLLESLNELNVKTFKEAKTIQAELTKIEETKGVTEELQMQMGMMETLCHFGSILQSIINCTGIVNPMPALVIAMVDDMLEVTLELIPKLAEADLSKLTMKFGKMDLPGGFKIDDLIKGMEDKKGDTNEFLKDLTERRTNPN